MSKKCVDKYGKTNYLVKQNYGPRKMFGQQNYFVIKKFDNTIFGQTNWVNKNVGKKNVFVKHFFLQKNIGRTKILVKFGRGVN